MKKILALIPAAAIAFTFAACKKETPAEGEVTSVSSLYRTVMFEYTATWCGPCGQYGYPEMHDLIADFVVASPKSSVVIMRPSDDIVDNVPAGQEDLVDFFGFSGTPDGAVGINGGMYPDYNAFKAKITAAHTANPVAKAGIGISHTLSGSTMTINTKTVFFEEVAGTYNLALYVVEDKVMNSQNGQTPATVEHINTLRVIADAKAFGSTVAVNPKKGEKVPGTYTVTLPAETRVKENCKVVAVLWKIDPATGEPTDVLNSNTY
jgi:hypothetical protein